MNQFVEVIKQVAVNAIESRKPVNVVYGTVISTSPFQVRLSQKEVYGAEFFIAAAGHEPYAAGDRLILIRVQGGQEYLIFGKKGAV